MTTEIAETYNVNRGDLESAAECLLRELPSEEELRLRVESATDPTPPGIVDHHIARLIDHTMLRPDATEATIRQYCREALEFSFASVCVHPSYVAFCASLMPHSPLRIATVVGFPLGAASARVKAEEARIALRDGARELDMVLHIGKLKDGAYAYVAEEIAGVVREARWSGATVKVILETCLLTDREKIIGSLIAAEVGADFVKTSTGFGTTGAQPRDVAILRQAAGPSMGVKASGGIRTRQQARMMITCGANRIGTSDGVSVACGGKRTRE